MQKSTQWQIWKQNEKLGLNNQRWPPYPKMQKTWLNIKMCPTYPKIQKGRRNPRSIGQMKIIGQQKILCHQPGLNCQSTQGLKSSRCSQIQVVNTWFCKTIGWEHFQKKGITTTTKNELFALRFAFQYWLWLTEFRGPHIQEKAK